MDSIRRTAAPAEIAEAARGRSGLQTAYLEVVRASLRRLATPELRPGDARGALASVESHANIDPDPPVVSRRFHARLARTAFRRLTGWDLRFLGSQVTVLGHAVVRFGTAMVERTERLEATTGAQSEELAALCLRVERLEQRQGGTARR